MSHVRALNATRRAVVRGGHRINDATPGTNRRVARARDDVLDVRGAVSLVVLRRAVTFVVDGGP